MLDPDVPPEVEGNTDGGAAAALLVADLVAEAQLPIANAKTMAASTPPPWTTAIEPISRVATTAPAAGAHGPASAAFTSQLTPILFPVLSTRIPPRASLPSSMTYSSSRRSRKPPVR